MEVIVCMRLFYEGYCMEVIVWRLLYEVIVWRLLYGGYCMEVIV